MSLPSYASLVLLVALSTVALPRHAGAAEPAAPAPGVDSGTADQARPPAPAAEKPPDPATPAEPAAAPPAVAPPPVAAPPVAAPKNLQLIFPGEATSILGKKVQDATAADMGRVVDILVDDSGQPRAAVIDFGGFLGVGSRKIAVDWRLLQFRPTDRKAPIQLSATRAEVQAAPEYKEQSGATTQAPTQVVTPPAEPPAPEGAK
jgi:PRC-barrel domain